MSKIYFFLFAIFLFPISLFAKEDPYEADRLEMVRDQIEARGVKNGEVLEAMRTVPRHLFVPKGQLSSAYADHPLPIGYGQTISQPYIVAVMTELAGVKAGSVALEVGTGSGYQAAILGEIAKEVYTIEIVPALAESAKKRLQDLEYKNVTVKEGDGYFGWKEHAPFDVILVTAAATHIPPPLVEQLKPGGKMVIPVGPAFFVQSLMVVEKRADGSITQRDIMPVAFVPLTGEH